MKRIFLVIGLILLAPLGLAVFAFQQNNFTPISTAAQVVALFTGCSGTQYLGADGACHTAATGVGTVSANNVAGSLATYAAGGGSTTVGPDAALVSNGTGTLTVGGAGLGTASLLLGGTTSGTGTIGCTGATCLTFTSSLAFVSSAAITATKFTNSSICTLGGASGTTSPAACGASAVGHIAIPASQTTYTINSSVVTANSIVTILQIADNSGITSSPTCNATATNPIQSARVAATSITFTLTTNAAVTCYIYTISS